MDTNRVEARFADGTTLALDYAAVEDEYGNTPADWRNEPQKTRGKTANRAARVYILSLYQSIACFIAASGAKT